MMTERANYRYEIQGTGFHVGVFAALRAYPNVCTISEADTAEQRLILASCTPLTADQLREFVDVIKRAGGDAVQVHPLEE
jgi:hypothetical protein